MTDQTARAGEGATNPCETGGQWPAGCRTPSACSRHATCMYAVSSRQCRHFAQDLTVPIVAARLQAAESRAASAEAEVERLLETAKDQSQETRKAWDEISRLTAERDAAIKVCEMNAMSGGFSARWAENATNRAEAAEASASALRDRVAVLESALKPFAHYADDMPEWGEGEIGEYFHDGVRSSIRTRDLRAARAALKESTHV